MKTHLTWSTIGAGLNTVIPIIAFILLAQKVSPSAFGVFAIVSILFGFVKTLLESGFKDVIIFDKINRDSPVLCSIFCFLLVLSFIFVLLFNLLKVPAANYFDIHFAPYILWVSLLFPLMPAKVISQALLESRMQFRAIAFIELTAQTIAAIVAIIMAYNNHGVLALIVMLITVEIIQIALYVLISSWKFTIHFSLVELKSTYDYSKHLIIFKLVNFIVDNIDKLLIGKYLGKAEVGFFHRSQQVTVAPAVFISVSIDRVLFPYISSIKSDLEVVRRIHVNIIAAVLLFFTPLMSILVVFSKELVLLILNENWSPMIPLLQVFSVGSLFRVISFTSVNIYKSLGYTKLQSQINILLKIVLMISIVIGLQFGIYGLAIALLSARIINFIITEYNVCKIITYSFAKILSQMTSMIFVISAYIFLLLALKETYYSIDSLFELFAIAFSYTACFYILLGLVFPQEIKNIKQIIWVENV